MLALSPMLMLLLMASFFDTTAGQIGICYGEYGNNLPSNSEAVAMYKQYNIRRMRMYSPNPNALDALHSQTEASTWVRDNVQKYNDYISVGNEVMPRGPGGAGTVLFQAMQNIDKALSEAGLSIPVSTTTYMGAFTDTYPPSRGRFGDDYLNFLKPVIGFLVSKRYPLLVNIYTYFGYKNGDVSLEFSLFKPSSNEFNDPNNQLQLHHQNLFDSNLDSVYVALEKSGGGSLKVVVSESGWPTQGGPGASVGNAEAYINNLIQHIRHVERYFGLFLPTTKQLKYGVNFN
ncbi:hypothetical protein BRARA_D00299 [Brassica rapa]|uniref:glucan endo-1,3-beta-D-glucosidase n=1 Tax=Brassica campestris TaxID=3711 RepID=A0A397ZHF5_BRACM|nr:hypothetical protein BRARA_D00299 [Brassica rapa]